MEERREGARDLLRQPAIAEVGQRPFEQLGRHCVPGPLVESLLLGDGRVAGSGGEWIEHLDMLDVVVVGEGRLIGVDPHRVEAEPSPWPLDPLTPVFRVAELPAGEPLDIADWDRPGAVVTAAFQLGLADRLTAMAVAYASERTQFDRSIGSFQAIKHMCADMLVRTDRRKVTLLSGS